MCLPSWNHLESGIKDHASSGNYCAGSTPTLPPKTQAYISLLLKQGQFSSRQLQLQHIVWHRRHTRELENGANFGVASSRKSVPKLAKMVYLTFL